MKALKNHIRMSLILAIILMPVTASSKEMLSVSVGSLSLAEREKIVGFQFNITAGRIAGLPAVPFGWNITIDNDPSWNTKLIGSSIVGSSALNIESLKNLIVIEKYEFMGLSFGIEAEIIVTQDFEKERRIRLKKENLLIKRL